jgi:hypothetical protein
VLLAPGAQAERPVVEVLAAAAERLVERGVGPGGEAVERDRYVCMDPHRNRWPPAGVVSSQMKALTAAAVAAAGILVLAPAAAGKDFRPGDIRACVASRCVPITSQDVLDALSGFYYGSVKPTPGRAPSAKALYVELRFRNGYVTGIAAGARFDHFLSYGVNLDQFRARIWYVMPASVAAELQQLAASLQPRPLPRYVLDRSH